MRNSPEENGRIRHFNTAIIVDREGKIAGKYRKVHLPGHHEHEPWRPFQHLEKAYFEPGNLGFPVFNTMNGNMGMCICNDRRWPETYRCMGLQDVEIIMLGYNTPRHFPQASKSTGCRTSTIICRYKPVHIKMGAGLSVWQKLASRTAAS